MAKKLTAKSLKTMSPTESEILTTAHNAFEKFSQGLATGEWQPFLAMLTDDFSFWFPVGKYQGLNVGKAKAEEFFQSVSTVFPGGLELTLERCTNSETTVVFEVRSQGNMLGHPYINQAAISFDIRGNQVCAYREYLGVLYQLGGNQQNDS